MEYFIEINLVCLFLPFNATTGKVIVCVVFPFINTVDRLLIPVIKIVGSYFSTGKHVTCLGGGSRGCRGQYLPVAKVILMC